MKIAAATQDGETLSVHFGMAPTYQIFSVVDGRVTSQETRPKPHHDHHPEQHDHGHGHGRHGAMFAPIQDCDVLLCGGMGAPAYEKARLAGLEVVMTSGNIREAVEAFLSGNITSDMRRVHQHR